MPPRWAHHLVNISLTALAFFIVYPGNAGHNYGTNETQGFRKHMIGQNGKPTSVDKPRWLTPEKRS